MRQDRKMPFTEKIGSLIYRGNRTVGFVLRNGRAPGGGAVFAGDSITAMCDLAKFYPGLHAVNRGISGDTTKGLLFRLRPTVIRLEPKLIVLLIGTNDFYYGRKSVEIADTYEKILDKMRTALPSCKIFVQSVCPAGNGSFGDLRPRNAEIKKLNTALIKLSDKYGCVYVDVFPVLAGDDGSLDPKLTKDGLHPNEKGYEAVSAVIRNALNAVESR
jgi:lysophospholipase L1-like esterase